MAVYLNPSAKSFEEAVNSDIYVDKTEMIKEINSVLGTKQKYVSVSRPRRFGKTMAADMLCAYYGKSNDTKELFTSRKLALNNPDDWDKELGKYDVIRLVMTDFIKKDVDVNDSIRLIRKRILNELHEQYPSVSYDEYDLFYSLEKYYITTETQFVIVLDEWDAVFRIRKDDKEGQNTYLDFLRDLFKDRNYVALAYMTGILPIKKYGEHSALNMFDEYSMISPMQLAEYTGFTKEEVEALCHKYNMDFDSVSEWYDGYVITDSIPLDKRELYRKGKYEEHKIQIFSPLSVVQAMRSGVIDNYWNNTETYEALAEYIRKNYDGLKEEITLLMNDGSVKLNISKYQNDMTSFQSKDDILTLLIHLGYLGYDTENKEAFIPNKEVLEVFKDSTSDGEWIEAFASFRKSNELLQATWNMNQDKVAEILEWAHDKADNKTYNDEAALNYAVRYAYYSAQLYYTTVFELDSGKGYADIVYIPSPKYSDKPAMVIELKYNKSADTALMQIKKQNYPDRLAHYKGNILLVGIDYDKDIQNTSAEYKRHKCIIEKA